MSKRQKRNSRSLFPPFFQLINISQHDASTQSHSTVHVLFRWYELVKTHNPVPKISPPAFWQLSEILLVLSKWTTSRSSSASSETDRPTLLQHYKLAG